jgi:hypothetical protein
MAGLFTLVWAAAVGASATKHAMTNAWCKENCRHKLPNGIEYYSDADGKYRLLNGTQILWDEYGTREKVIEAKTRRVIYDRGAEIDRETRRQEQITKEKAQTEGRLLYIKRNPRCYDRPVFFEFKTGKQLAKIAKVTYWDTKEVEYKKWYFYDHLKESLPPGTSLRYGAKTSHESIKYGDKGVVITKEEFEQLQDDYFNVKLRDGEYEVGGWLKIVNDEHDYRDFKATLRR